MSRRLIIRPEAETEMAEAFDWYEGRVPGLGSDFLLSVDAVIQLKGYRYANHTNDP